MNLLKAKEGALGIIRELGPGGRGNSVIQNIGSKANKAVLSSSAGGILLKNKPANASNLFTGIGLSKIGVAAVGAAIAGSAVKGGYDNVENIKNSYRPQAEDLGTYSGMSYDAIGSVSGGQRNLGATGDLVFGLHTMDNNSKM